MVQRVRAPRRCLGRRADTAHRAVTPPPSQVQRRIRCHTGCEGTRLCAGCPVRRGRRWQRMVGAAQWTCRERDAAERVARAAQSDAPDVRPRPADRCHLVTGRPVHRLRLRQGRQLRHLGAARHRRRCRAGHEGSPAQDTGTPTGRRTAARSCSARNAMVAVYSSCRRLEAPSAV